MEAEKYECPDPGSRTHEIKIKAFYSKEEKYSQYQNEQTFKLTMYNNQMMDQKIHPKRTYVLSLRDIYSNFI